MIRAPRKLTKHTMPNHIRSLSRQCEYMAQVFKAIGIPQARNRDAGFETLLRIIVDQQISVQAGEAIWAKLEQRFGEISAERISTARPSTLQKCGLSRQKIRYASELAGAVRSGSLDLNSLGDLDDESAINQLTAIKGIGSWTAEIYLMFAMGRPDIFPAGDLALQLAAQNLFGLKEKPKIKEFRFMAKRWAPYRTAASIMLWQYYRKASLIATKE